MGLEEDHTAIHAPTSNVDTRAEAVRDQILSVILDEGDVEASGHEMSDAMTKNVEKTARQTSQQPRRTEKADDKAALAGQVKVTTDQTGGVAVREAVPDDGKAVASLIQDITNEATDMAGKRLASSNRGTNTVLEREDPDTLLDLAEAGGQFGKDRRGDALSQSLSGVVGAIAVGGPESQNDSSDGNSRERPTSTGTTMTDTPPNVVESALDPSERSECTENPYVQTPSGHFLMEAEPVEEETIFNADPVQEGYQPRTSQEIKQEDQRRHQRIRMLIGFALVVVVVIIIGSILGVAFSRDNEESDTTNNDSDKNDAVDMVDEKALFAEEVYRVGSFLALSNTTVHEIISNENSAQHQAYQWLVEDPYFADATTDDNALNTQWKVVQRFALAVVYFAMGGEGWTSNEGWLDHDKDECGDWFYRTIISDAPQMGNAANFDHPWEVNPGVAIDSPCDANGKFQFLALSDNNMVGTIPPEIELLHDSLQYLDVSANRGVAGSVPTQMGKLTQLTRFFANRCGFTGALPTQFGYLSNLEIFDVGNNQHFTSQIPSEFGLATALKVFSTQRSSVSGFVPTELFLLTNLEEYLVHQSLNITGGSLEGIGALSNLREFVAHDVPYGSTIPTEVGLLTHLLNFNLWNTQVYGPIPSEIWEVTSLHRIDIDDNLLTGTFPNELFQLSLLQILFINGNQLKGTLPSSGWQQMPNLTTLNVGGNDGGNQLTGTIPTTLGVLTSMTRLAFNMMDLTGTIPSELGNMAGIEKLLLHNTLLEGTIPTELEALTALESFTVSTTNLTGSIPEGLCSGLKEVNMKCLSYFGVQGNVCSGYETRDFNCSNSMLCGCSCAACAIGQISSTESGSANNSSM